MINSKKEIKVAVAGNPNTGKSTLINAIAGTRLNVGNWPGVTVEKKEAQFEYKNVKINLIDLPGIYSLSPYSQEEIIARDFLVHEKPDVIINVVDATNLERNLYLTVQLSELGIPIIMALNIHDEAKRKGIKIDIKSLESLLNIKVIPTVATKKEGIINLMDEVLSILSEGKQRLPYSLSYGEEIEGALKNLKEIILRSIPYVFSRYQENWILLKVLEGDERVIKEINLKITDEIVKLRKNLENIYGEDIESILTNVRYGIASGVAHQVLDKKESTKIDITEKIDKIVLNRYLGMPIFLITMWIVFKLAFDVSSPFVDWIDAVIQGPLKRWISLAMYYINSPDWTVSLITDGVIAGTGFVLVFVPVIGMMMLIITFLEASGYMARAAFVMDRLMHIIGLHGKSFIPMLLGFGCNVPSIYATRILETERDKKLTAMLVPFMSCGARLPVYVVFIGAFFPNHAGTVLWSLYILGIFMAIILGFIFKKTIYKGLTPMFIMELPPYRVPTMRDLFIHTWQKLKHFVIKAGTYILAVSIIVWFMLNIPWGVKDKKDTILGRMGTAISPIFKPLGFGSWEASSSLITGLIAKEVVVGTMSQIYVQKNNEIDNISKKTLSEDLKEITNSFITAVKDSFENIFGSIVIKSLTTEETHDEKEERKPLRQSLHNLFTPISAYAFIVFVLLYWPCVVVGIATKQEFGTWKVYASAVLVHSIIAWTLSFIVYQIGNLFL